MKCPECRSTHVVKCGRRKTKRGSRQQYHCNNCGTRFVDNPFPNKTYSPKVIIGSLKLFYRGHTLKNTSKKINRRYKVNTSKSTIYNWINEFKDICSYSKKRKEHRKKHGHSLIKKNTFYHGGLRYDFKYHIGKLDDERNYNQDIVRFIQDVPRTCPNELFNDESNETKRASALDMNIDDNIDLYKTTNQACRLAELSLKANHNRKKRHEQVEDFFLTCDSATIATELPVWYYDKTLETSITGHVDLVQLRSGKVFLLDYKPDAKNESPITQLYTYSRAFSYRTKTPLKKIRAAWFDENDYIQFSPSEVR